MFPTDEALIELASAVVTLQGVIAGAVVMVICALVAAVKYIGA